MFAMVSFKLNEGRISGGCSTIGHELTAERQRLIKANAYDADAYNEWCMDRIVDEMNTRDRHWLKTGEPVPIDYTEKTQEQYGRLIDPSLPIEQRYQFTNITGEDNERKDSFFHDVLSENCFYVKGRLTIHQGGDENIDIDLNHMLCEAKARRLFQTIVPKTGTSSFIETSSALAISSTTECQNKEKTQYQ